MKWNGNLSDAASKNFKTLTSTIQQNVRFIICYNSYVILFTLSWFYSPLVKDRVGPFILTPGKELIIDVFSDGEAFLKKVHASQCPLKDKRVEKLPSFICKKTSIWGWGIYDV